MRSVEEKIDIPESRKDDFRREIANYIGRLLAIDGKRFDYKTNERLAESARIETVRRSERYDKADKSGSERRRQGDAAKKSTWSRVV